MSPAPGEVVRLDKFLWAARFFKTRALSVLAIEGARVTVNGERTKPSRTVRVGDRLAIRRPPYEHVVVIRALSDKRGPASAAQALYAETAESLAKREAVRAEVKAMPPPAFKGRPTKKSRREYEKWLYAQDEE